MQKLNIFRKMKMFIFMVIAVFSGLCESCIASAAVPSNNEDVIWLSSLDLGKMTCGWGKPLSDKSVQGNTLTISGKTFGKGVGTHANSVMFIDLKGGSKRLSAWVGTLFQA